MTEEVFRWEDLPPARNWQPEWGEIAARLRSRPNEWAVVATYSTQNQAAVTARHVRMGKMKAMPIGRFEAHARTVGDEYRVYVRYVEGSDG